MKARERNLDVLRVLAALMVVILHVSAPYVTSNMKEPNLYFTIGNFFDAITRVCVPIFIMISGTFILDNDKNREYGKFYKKTFVNIIVPTLIWSLIYVVYSITKESVLMGDEANYFKYLKNWIQGNPFYHLWYMYMIIGLYAVAPVLIKIKEEIGEKSIFKVGICLTLLGIIIDQTSNLFWIIKFILYLGYFILGYSLKKYYTLNKKKPFKYILGWIISSLCVFGATEIIIRTGYTGIRRLYFYGYLSPFVIIGAICLFIAFVNMKDLNINMGNLAKHSFNIYFIHAGILDVISLVKDRILHVEFNPIWYIPVMAIIVFILSYVGSLLVSKTLGTNMFTRIRNKIQEVAA